MRRMAVFGYVKAWMPELRVCELEYYRAAYCGLCRACGRCTGCRSRMLLNYDFAFLALVRMALTGERAVTERRRCIVHPTHRRVIMTQRGQLDYCAYASALLSYHKCRDDVADESGGRRLRARAGLVFMRHMHRAAAKQLPGLERVIIERLGELGELERSGCASVDIPAGVFGRITEAILEHGLEGSTAAVARQIGYHVGKWIYMADALDDYDDDVKRGRYNPLALMWPDGMDGAAREEVRIGMRHELADAELGFGLLEIDDGRLRGVINNIIYCGMTRKAEDRLHKDE